MSDYTIHNSEFVSWAEEVAAWGWETKFHAVLCDPPYGISFMGKEWDKPDAFRRAKNENDVGRNSVFGRSSRTSPEYLGGLDFQTQAKTWGEALIPLLYPGAIVMMFSGTRMWHRLAAGMEDAGFHLWDTLMWLHGQGFPKGQDISKLIDKKNGDERTNVIGRYQPPGMDKPWNLTNAKDERTIPLSASSRNNLDILAPASEVSSPWSGHKTPQLKPAWEPILCFKTPSDEKYVDLALKYGSGCLNIDAGRISTNTSQGRYPANLALDEESAVLLDEQTGILTSGKSKPEYRKKAGNKVFGAYANDDMPINVIGDSGGASRFFYCSKATQKERSAGLDDKNEHPTIKPLDLNKWLANLLLPPSSVKNRRILVPFSGSGSEMIGAIQAGWDEVVGVEMNKEYCDIAEKRLLYYTKDK